MLACLKHNTANCTASVLEKNVQGSSLLTSRSCHHIQPLPNLKANIVHFLMTSLPHTDAEPAKLFISSFPNHFLPHYLFSLKSTTLLLALSKLPRLPLLELLELPRLFLLASSGSVGCNPLAFANRFKISVKLTTPLNLPDICCPGIAEAETDGVALRGRKGGLACGKEVEMCCGCGTGG